MKSNLFVVGSIDPIILTQFWKKYKWIKKYRHNLKKENGSMSNFMSNIRQIFDTLLKCHSNVNFRRAMWRVFEIKYVTKKSILKTV